MEQFNYTLPYQNIFGGVIALTHEQFTKMNGFSNRYWAWGGEDDDLSRRARQANYSINRENPKVSRYSSLYHKGSERNPKRIDNFLHDEGFWKLSGLNNIVYNKQQVVEEPLFTHIIVELNELFDHVNSKEKV